MESNSPRLSAQMTPYLTISPRVARKLAAVYRVTTKTITASATNASTKNVTK